METVSFGRRPNPVADEPVQSVGVAVYDKEDRRAVHRSRVLKGAHIRFNKGYGAYSCTVKNLTNDGALVMMEDSSGLPKEFEFVVKGEDAKRTASVAWRKAGQAGLRFHSNVT